jgi:hypothetical protein
MVADPNFSELLMSTFFMGANMSEQDKLKCESIWKEKNNDRSEVLKVVVDLCGDINTPQTRYIKALAWSFNSVEYSRNRIDSINNYLNNELYEKAYINLAPTIENGITYGKKFHIGIMLQYMAQAYCHLKDFENEEKTYIKIYELNLLVPNGSILLAKFYKKRNNLRKAIEVLEGSKKSQHYKNDVNYKKEIDSYLLEYEKKEKGINKHYFDGYDSYQSGFVNGNYYPKLEKQSMELRKKYKQIFDYHREFLENIDFCEYNLKQGIDVEENKKDFVTYCLSDINIYPKINNYYIELNKIGFEGKYEYSDKRVKSYPIFKKLISFYEKEKNYKDAIKLCDIAISYGITKYVGNTSMNDKKEKLLSKIK